VKLNFESPSRTVYSRFIKQRGGPYDLLQLKAKERCRELFDPSLVKLALLSMALLKNRSCARLLKQRGQSRGPIDFCPLMIKPPGRQLIGQSVRCVQMRATLVKHGEFDENARNEEAKGAILQRKRRPLHREERKKER